LGEEEKKREKKGPGKKEKEHPQSPGGGTTANWGTGGSLPESGEKGLSGDVAISGIGTNRLCASFSWAAVPTKKGTGKNSRGLKKV